MAILTGPGVSSLEVFALYYGMTAKGWRVSLAAASTAPPRDDRGFALPVDLPLAQLAPKTFKVLFVPTGAPRDPTALAVLRTFAMEGLVALPSANAPLLELAGLKAELADDEAMTRLDGRVLSAARPGDLPALMHALESYAQDALRRAHVAGGGDPP